MTNVSSQKEDDAWLERLGTGARELNCSQPGCGLSPDKLGRYQGPSYRPSVQGRGGASELAGNVVNKKKRKGERGMEGL